MEIYPQRDLCSTAYREKNQDRKLSYTLTLTQDSKVLGGKKGELLIVRTAGGLLEVGESVSRVYLPVLKLEKHKGKYQYFKKKKKLISFSASEGDRIFVASSGWQTILPQSVRISAENLVSVPLNCVHKVLHLPKTVSTTKI